jgi:Ni,Fe-hydrogenase maturation factor
VARQVPTASHEEAVLIIGYGNLSRRDDSVAWHIMQRLRQRLGLPIDDLDLEQDPIDAEGRL